MKARIKETGEIVNINEFCTLYDSGERTYYWANELELITQDNPDYWTRLEHQYAGMAMEALIKNVYRAKNHEIAGMAAEIAHTLVQKMKEEN